MSRGGKVVAVPLESRARPHEDGFTQAGQRAKKTPRKAGLASTGGW
jgi:hypothetical protein